VIVLAERTSPPLRARLAACDCGAPRCSTVFVALSLDGPRDLWVTVGLAMDGVEQAEGIAADLLGAPDRDLGDLTLRQLVERGMALVGLAWSQYESNESMEAQVAAWTVIPRWMECQPAARLWALRKVVFGRPLTRVPRALWAHANCYVPDQAEAYEDFAQTVRWGVLRERWGDMPVPGEVLLDTGRWDT
jgi:hypothetical protein